MTRRGSDGMAPLRRPALSNMRRNDADQPAGLVFHRTPRGRIEHVDTPTSGRCRRAESIPARILGGRKARTYEETRRPFGEKLGEVPDWLIYGHSRPSRRTWKGRYRGQRQEMVRGALHRQGFRNQRRSPAAATGEFSPGLGADEESSRVDRPVQRPVYERVVKEFFRPSRAAR